MAGGLIGGSGLGAGAGGGRGLGDGRGFEADTVLELVVVAADLVAAGE